MAARGEPGERNRDPNPFEISRWKATRSSRKAEDGCDLSRRNVAMKHLTPNNKLRTKNRLACSTLLVGAWVHLCLHRLYELDSR